MQFQIPILNRKFHDNPKILKIVTTIFLYYSKLNSISQSVHYLLQLTSEHHILLNQ